MFGKLVILTFCTFIDIMMIINIFNRVISRVKNRKLVGSRIFRFRGESVVSYMLPFIAMTLSILNALSSIRYYRMKGSTNEVLAYAIGVNDIASMYWKYAVSVVFLLYFLILIEFLYLMIFKSEIYEEGILKFDGKLITWKEIECVEFEDSFWKFNKKAMINLNSNRNFTQIVCMKDFEAVSIFIEARVKSNIK